MGSRVLSWLSHRRRSPGVLTKDVEHEVKRSHVADASDNSAPFNLVLPLDIWIIVIDILSSQVTDRRHLVPLTQVCRDIGHIAEEAIYHHVSVGPNESELRSFLQAVCKNDHRAAAVRTLRIRVPDVAFTTTTTPSSSSQPTVLPILPGHTTSPPATQLLDSREAGSLRQSIAQAFERLVNLTVLDFNDLQVLPVVCASSAFRLVELKTSGKALSLAISRLQSRMSADPEGFHESPSALISVEKLTVDMHTGLQLSELRLFSITHLNIDRARFLPLAEWHSSLPALPNLLSLRVMWSVHSGINMTRSDLVLWPTRILGYEPMRRLRRLELCECRIPFNLQTVYSYSNLEVDIAEHLGRIKQACPSITTLVWWPSRFHCKKARLEDTFGEALVRYTEGLFETWPTLMRFERLTPESDTQDNPKAFVRNQDGSISDIPAEYDEVSWGLVQAD